MAGADAALPCRVGLYGSRRLRGQLCRRSGGAPVQNIQIGVVERECARLLNGGLSEYRACREGCQ